MKRNVKKTHTNIRPANGTKGVLLIEDNEIYFRVYQKDHSFTDYKIGHSDLSVVIEDSDAFFYEEDSENPILDHAPQTLGIKHKTNSKIPK